MRSSLYKTDSLCVRPRSALALMGAVLMGVAGMAGMAAVPQVASA